MLNKFLHVVGRVFSILMGWRRTHRPGDLTARIFAEHDRALARLAQSVTAPVAHHLSKFKSSLPQMPKVKASRIAIRAERIELIANRAVKRIAQTNAIQAKRDTRRVVWLSSARNTAQVAGQTKLPAVAKSNVIALRKRGTHVNACKSKAA